MASKYAAIRQEQTIGSPNTARLCDFDETDPFYFVVKENDKILAEGELPHVKLKLDEEYLYKKIKKCTKDRVTMVTTIEY